MTAANSGRQNFAALATTGGEYAATVLGAHALHKTVFFLVYSLFGLVSAFHG